MHARGAMPGLKYPYTLSSVVNFWKLEEVFWKRNRSPMGAVHICMPEGLMRNPVIEASLCKHIECDILHLKVAKLCYRTQWLPEVHLKDRSIQTHCLVWWTSENWRSLVFWKRIWSPMGTVNMCMPEWLMHNPMIEASICKHIKYDILRKPRGYRIWFQNPVTASSGWEAQAHIYATTYSVIYC